MEVSTRVLRSVVGRIVHQDDGVVAEVGILRFQLLGQTAQELHDHVAISVDLRQRVVYLARAGESHDHAYPRLHLLDRYRRRLSFLAPPEPRELDLVQPGLIHIDYPLAIVERLHKSLSIEASKGKIPLAIALESNGFDFAKSHVEGLR